MARARKGVFSHCSPSWPHGFLLQHGHPQGNLSGYKIVLQNFSSVKSAIQQGRASVAIQVKCGCCWPFSITGFMEGALKTGMGNLESLPEQQLVDGSLNGSAAPWRVPGRLAWTVWSLSLSSGSLTTPKIATLSVTTVAWNGACL